MKRTLFAMSLFLTASSLSMFCSAQTKSSRIRPVIAYAHATITAPPGMVYIPGGTTIIKYSSQATDSNCVKKVSLSSYFIDKCEVTNQQYRQFVEWVVDSIAIVKYLHDDDKYFKDVQVKDSTGKEIGVRRINWAHVDHKDLFENNADTRAKLANMIDERGQIKRDSIFFGYSHLRALGTNPKNKIGTWTTENVPVYPDEAIWAKDLPNAQTEIMVANYFTSEPYDDYPVVGVTYKQACAYAYWRSLTSNGYSEIADYLKNYHLTYTLPSEAQWVYAACQDMSAFNGVIENNGPTAKDDTKADAKKDEKEKPAEEEKKTSKKKGGKKNKKDNAAARDTMMAATPVAADPLGGGAADPNSRFSASSGITVDNSAALKDTMSFYDPAIPDERTPIASDKKGLMANFKQGEGDYTGDGSPFTVPVMSYAANKFGVYNMVGNVAEWTQDAYSPSAFAFVSDINPVLLYDADSNDADAMKRKVVRGGSFISNAKALSPYARDQYMQGSAHCYIGFRCVMAAPEILSGAVATRKKSGKRK